jgi:arylsulfatase A-like enzyme
MLGAAAAPRISLGSVRSAGVKPNLLFLITDQQRADTMAGYGNYRFHVPNMNRLCAEGVVFDRCYASQPICAPSRSAMQTGQWPHTTQVLTNSRRLPQQAKVFPELLADSDYRTGYFGEWHLGDELFPQHGYQEWISLEDSYGELFSEGHDKNAVSDYSKYLVSFGYKPDEKGRPAFSRDLVAKLPFEHRKSNFLASKATDFILRHQSQPWILFVSFIDPHVPFYGPLNDAHTVEEAPLPPNYPGYPIEHEPRFYQYLRQGFQTTGYKNYRSLPGHDLKNRGSFERLSRNYAGLCSEADGAFGRILWALEASGQIDNTIIVHTADHGEMMGAHGLIGKEVMYEESIRVPLVMRVPFQHVKPMHITTPVTNVDLVPTLLELMGGKIPESVQGQSLVPALKGEPLRRNCAFVEWNREDNDSASKESSNGRALITPDGWKLIVYAGDECMLLNRIQDPLEMQNLYYKPESAGVVKELRQIIQSWQKHANDPLPI